MKHSLSLLPLLICASLGGTALAQAQAPAKPTAKQAAPATAAKPKAAAAKPVQPPPPPPLPDASEEQMAAIERAYLGTYDCEFQQSISITRNIKQGYLDVMWQRSSFTMKPVLSSTGALRLEDVTGRTLMIQIANKSMLMDTKIGQRLVDECIHPEQRAAIERLKAERAAAVASGVRGPDNGLGIEPKSPTAVAVATAVSAAATAASAATAAASAADSAAVAAAKAADAASAVAASVQTPAASAAGMTTAAAAAATATTVATAASAATAAASAASAAEGAASVAAKAAEAASAAVAVPAAAAPPASATSAPKS